MHHSNSSDISPQASKDLLLREAKRLHRAAQSDSPAESLPVLRRLLAAEAIPGPTLPAAFRARTQVQRKHVLRALALEAGYPSWEALVAALGDADLLALGQGLQALRGAGVLKLWFSSMAQAQEYTRTHGGQAIAMGSQAVVLEAAPSLPQAGGAHHG